jgi:hypothetical protein
VMSYADVEAMPMLGVKVLVSGGFRG